MMKKAFLLLLIILPGMLGSCGSDEPPLPTTIGEACQQEEFARVTVNGYLRLFSQTATICRGDKCDLAFYSQPDGQGALMTARVDVSDKPDSGQNAIAPLSTFYELDDLHIYTAAGDQVGPDANLQLTGYIKNEDGRCYLSVTTIETP